MIIAVCGGSSYIEPVEDGDSCFGDRDEGIKSKASLRLEEGIAVITLKSGELALFVEGSALRLGGIAGSGCSESSDERVCLGVSPRLSLSNKKPNTSDAR